MSGAMRDARRPIAILTTGGTIASRLDPARGGFRPQVAGSELARAAGAAPDVEVEEFSNIPADHMTPIEWHRLARRVRELTGGDAPRAVVITHGTDALEETAYWLHLTVPPRAPVVLTGAQRTADAPDADGPRNLADAIAVAAHPSTPPGVYIAFAGQIHSARLATKVQTWAYDAFGSGPYGRLGDVIRGEPVWRQTPVPGAAQGRFDPARFEPRVEIIATYPGAGELFFRAAVSAGARGLVVQAMGVGNSTPGVLEGVRRAAGAGLAVLVTSRVHHGPVMPLYAFEGGGKTLQEAGAIFAGDLPASKARVLLMLALGQSNDPARVRELIEAATGKAE